MIKLRPHQVEAIENVNQAWTKHKNVLMVMPTGLRQVYYYGFNNPR